MMRADYPSPRFDGMTTDEARGHLFIYRGRWQMNLYMDGDTFTAVLDQGHDDWHLTRIRIAGLNQPERNTPEGTLATMALYRALYSGVGDWPLLVVSKQKERTVDTIESFERWVCDVYVTVNGKLVDVVQLIREPNGN